MIAMYLVLQGWCSNMDKLAFIKQCIENTHLHIYELNCYLDKLEKMYMAEMTHLAEKHNFEYGEDECTDDVPM